MAEIPGAPFPIDADAGRELIHILSRYRERSDLNVPHLEQGRHPDGGPGGR
jgi:hypothetical protein